MRALSRLVACLCWLPPAAAATDPAELAAFMAGDYTVVGRKPDSQATYTGKLTLRARGPQLDFVRTVGGRSVRGTVVFDTVAGSDRIPVLKMRFRQHGREYAATYQWMSDYDNYCRFTGYVFRHNGRNRRAGLEALFPVAPSIR